MFLTILNLIIAFIVYFKQHEIQIIWIFFPLTYLVYKYRNKYFLNYILSNKYIIWIITTLDLCLYLSLIALCLNYGISISETNGKIVISIYNI
jgi:hypothetical protein